MKMRTIFGIGIALAMSTPAMSATNLLKNGSFEGGFTDWTTTNIGGGSAPQVITYGSTTPGAFGEAVGPNGAPSLSSDSVGTRMAYFSSDTANPDTLSQTINLVAGTMYNIGFDYYIPQNGFSNPFDATLGFFVDKKQVGSILTAGSAPGTAVTWSNFGSSFVSDVTAPVTLGFQFRGLGVTAADFAVDRVYVQAVPEPATWMMMLFGFGLLGHAMRRRTKSGLRQSFA